MCIKDIYTKNDREVISALHGDLSEHIHFHKYLKQSNRIIFIIPGAISSHILGVTCFENVLTVYSEKLMHITDWPNGFWECIMELSWFLKIGSFDFMVQEKKIGFFISVPLYEKPPKEFVLDLLYMTCSVLDTFVPEVFYDAEDYEILEHVEEKIEAKTHADYEKRMIQNFYR